MSVAAIVQARMTSTRLPGKVLAPIMGRPMLAYLIERVRRAELVDSVVVATTEQPTDDEVVRVAEASGATVWRGPEDDVLDRYLGAARMVDAHTVVRITADCPLIDPAVIDATIRSFRAEGYDLASPDDMPDGMGLHVLTRELLETMAAEATAQPDREHVTLWAVRRPTRFRIGHLHDDVDRSALRWTVDEAPDLEFVRTIFEYLYPRNRNFGYEDILWALSGHPEWVQINAGVVGKTWDASPVAA